MWVRITLCVYTLRVWIPLISHGALHDLRLLHDFHDSHGCLHLQSVVGEQDGLIAAELAARGGWLAVELAAAQAC